MTTAETHREDKGVPALPPLSEALWVGLKIGLRSFGGPAGQIALLHREVVEDRRWVSERRFLHALNFCHLLPGPEAQQLAIYLGWLMHGAVGGFAAGWLFVLPGALVLLILSMLFATLGTLPLIAALFFGLKSAVLVLVVEAVLRIGRRALKGPAAWSLAYISFLALFFFNVPFPVVVLVAAAVGLAFPGYFSGGAHRKDDDGPPALLDAVLEAAPERSQRFARGARVAGAVSAVLWLTPVAALLNVGGLYADLALFFSKMAVVTFGGAYAVLAYVAQEVVQRYHWLTAPEMLSGLGLAETTPGPLILVLQFVGFLAGYRAPGPLTGIAGGIMASILTLWVTFMPCFAFVFLGAPLVERLQQNRSLSGALAAVTAAVVGVVANLAVWFSLHVLFRETVPFQGFGITFDGPVLSSVNPWAIALALVAGAALFRFKLGVISTLAICSVASVILFLALGVT